MSKKSELHASSSMYHESLQKDIESLLSEDGGLGETMLDVLVAGAEISNQISDDDTSSHFQLELENPEYRLLQKVFLQFNPVLDSKRGRMVIAIKSKGTIAKLILNEHNGKYYFNIEGNPISFLTGDNVVGTVNVRGLVTIFYRACFAVIRYQLKTRKNVPDDLKEFSVPANLRTKILNLDVVVHRLAFACYSDFMHADNKRHLRLLFDAIEHIFTFTIPDMEPNKLKDALGLKIVRDGPYSIRFEKIISGNKYYSVTVYDKNEERESRGKERVDVAENRVRFDITLFNYYLGANRIARLSRLDEMHGDDYKTWTRDLFSRILNDLKLKYIFSFSLPKNNKYIEKWEQMSNEFPMMHQTHKDRFMLAKDKRRVKALRVQLEKLGIDWSISLDAHTLAIFGKATFGFDKGTAKKAVVGNEKAIKAINDKFNSGFNNSNLLEILNLSLSLAPLDTGIRLEYLENSEIYA